MMNCFGVYRLVDDLWICPDWRNLKASTRVIYVDKETLIKYELEAPAEKGFYNLYEEVDENKNHVSWLWEKVKS